MKIEVRRAEYPDVEQMRDLYRQECDCQIIADSLLRRKLADPYLILVEGRVGGYGGVRNKYDPDRVMEFYALPHLRGVALAMFREFLAASRATTIQAQTNIPTMLMMLYDCTTDITTESILFHDAFTSNLDCHGGVFRHAAPGDRGPDPEAEWVVESKGAIVASGGFLCHYNPPYGDVYMAVVEPARRQGFGSYLVQEVKRVCYTAGRRPAARCNPGNLASRKTLEKAGFLPCGRLLIGQVKPSS